MATFGPFLHHNKHRSDNCPLGSLFLSSITRCEFFCTFTLLINSLIQVVSFGQAQATQQGVHTVDINVSLFDYLIYF